jgi:Sulfatase
MIDSLNPNLSKVALLGLLVVEGILLVAPKAILIDFSNTSLWGNIDLWNLGGAVAQDVALSAALMIASYTAISSRRWGAIGAAFTCVSLVLFVLLMDMRVRELWLKPIDSHVLIYAFQNAGDLVSGQDLFFRYTAGLGLPFQRLLVLFAAIHIALWTFIAIIVRQSLRLRRPRVRSGAVALQALICLSLIIVGSSIFAKYHYRMNENIFIEPFASLYETIFSPPDQISELSSQGFEQETHPLSKQLSMERKLFPHISPYKNVVLVIYESVRWQSVATGNRIKPEFPVLAKLASEGLLSKAYVSVPHSSKAYYAILSGRHPYPGVEIREALSFRHESIWHDFVARRNASTFAFSSLFLGFENMGGLLKSLGLQERQQIDQLAKLNGKLIASNSSFGSSDDLLYQLGAEQVGKASAPFAAVFFPLAAHYPYNCPGELSHENDYLKYEACLRYSDDLLGKLIEEFRRRKLMSDTLFVIVGDHGESFGEHGLFVHNSSMYEEEVTVPLVMWSEDKRMSGQFLQAAREIDIAPTIADLLGILDNNIPVQGMSLLRRGDEVQPIYMATFFDYVSQALIDFPVKYIYQNSADQLRAYNLLNDPEDRSPSPVEGNQRNAILERLKSFRLYQANSFATGK